MPSATGKLEIKNIILNTYELAGLVTSGFYSGYDLAAGKTYNINFQSVIEIKRLPENYHSTEY